MNSALSTAWNGGSDGSDAPVSFHHLGSGRFGACRIAADTSELAIFIDGLSYQVHAIYGTSDPRRHVEWLMLKLPRDGTV